MCGLVVKLVALVFDFNGECCGVCGFCCLVCWAYWFWYAGCGVCWDYGLRVGYFNSVGSRLFIYVCGLFVYVVVSVFVDCLFVLICSCLLVV